MSLLRPVAALAEIRELDVTGWPVTAPENRGKREKFWILAPHGNEWLRKEPRLGRPYERAVEGMVLRLARCVGLSAPESHLCWWSQGSEVRRGIVVKRFTRQLLRSRYELSLGGDLIRGVDPGYDPNQRGAHTLPRIRETLLRWEEALHGAGMLQQFSDMVLFDAWVGNSDRHQENWGVLHRPDKARLAPIFDTAACLGSELLDSHGLLVDRPHVRVEEYISRCGSGFGSGAPKELISQDEVIRQMASWPEWKESKRWLPKFRRALDHRLGPFLATCPDGLWPGPRRELALCLLRKRLEWLEARTT